MSVSCLTFKPDGPAAPTQTYMVDGRGNADNLSDPIGRHEEDWSLSLFTEVLHLRSLHWGLWTPGVELTLQNLSLAQQQFTDHLATFIPPGISSVLDVGCGMGDVAQVLSRQGLDVTCISPDPAHARAFSDIHDPNIHFMERRFEDFESDQRFDLVLFCESCDYFDPDDLFSRSQALLRADGHVLAASMFRQENTGTYWHHVLDDWLAGAKRHGFTVVRTEDVTERALPTTQLLHEIAQKYAAPSILFALRMLRSGRSFRSRLLRLFFRRQISAIETELIEPSIQRLDPRRFAAESLYAFVLLQHVTGASS